MKNTLETIFKKIVIILGLFTAAIYLTNLQALGISYKTFLTGFIIIISLFLIIHGIFTLFWMLYAWENPEDVDSHKSPKEFYPPPTLIYCSYSSQTRGKRYWRYH